MKSIIIIFRKSDNFLKFSFLCGTISGALGGCWFGKLPIFPPWPRGNAAPRLQISKYPAKNTGGYSNIQIYSSTSMQSRAPNLSNIFEYWSSKLYGKNKLDTLMIKNCLKRTIFFTGNNRRTDSPDLLLCHTDFAVCTLCRGSKFCSKYPNITHDIKLLVKKNFVKFKYPLSLI